MSRKLFPAILAAAVILVVLIIAGIVNQARAVEIEQDEPKAVGLLVIPAKLSEPELKLWHLICQMDNERRLAERQARQETARAERTETQQESEERNLRYLGQYKITGYDPFCAHCCGKDDGITTSGIRAVIGETVAMYGMEFGTRIYIDGLGEYTVHDRGVGPGKVDVACDGHPECFKVTGWYDVYVVEEVEP